MDVRSALPPRTDRGAAPRFDALLEPVAAPEALRDRPERRSRGAAGGGRRLHVGRSGGRRRRRRPDEERQPRPGRRLPADAGVVRARRRGGRRRRARVRPARASTTTRAIARRPSPACAKPSATSATGSGPSSMLARLARERGDLAAGGRVARTGGRVAGADAGGLARAALRTGGHPRGVRRTGARAGGLPRTPRRRRPRTATWRHASARLPTGRRAASVPGGGPHERPQPPRVPGLLRGGRAAAARRAVVAVLGAQLLRPDLAEPRAAVPQQPGPGRRVGAGRRSTSGPRCPSWRAVRPASPQREPAARAWMGA